MKNGRRKFSGDEKMVILRRHLVEKRPVSDVCDQAGINPTLFYRWQKELFENGAEQQCRFALSLASGGEVSVERRAVSARLALGRAVETTCRELRRLLEAKGNRNGA